jgi:hypothetical protein
MPRSDVQALHKLAHAVRAWEKDAAAGEYRELEASWRILQNTGSTAQSEIIGQLTQRALRRLYARPNGQQIKDAREELRLARSNPAAYQRLLLRREFAAVEQRVLGLEQRVLSLEQAPRIGAL